MKILFLGSSHFSKIVLKTMLEQGLEVVSVITSPDKEMGRGHKLQANEVKVYALEKNIKVICCSKIKNILDELKNIEFDLSVVASFGQILPDEFLNLKLCINVHPSKLPIYRGASPIQNTLLNGDKETAVTIMKVAREVDAGDIILQKPVKILEGEYYSSLEERLAKIGGELIAETVNLLKKDEIKFKKQDDKFATYVKKFEKEDGLLNFNSENDKLYNQVRALSDNLGVYFNLKNQKIKVFSAIPCEINLPIGQVANDKKRFIIGCNKGSLEILSCQSPSGKKMSGTDFLNGFKPQGEFVNELC